MSKKEIVRKNLELLDIFMKYAFDNPEVLDKIPENAQVVILPENDPELYEENTKIIEAHRKKRMPVAIFRMKIPEPVTPELQEVMS